VRPVIAAPRQCTQCDEPFLPKPRGFNAKFCSDRCKRRDQRARLLKSNPEQLRAARARSYQSTKNHPDRLAGHRLSGSTYRTKVRKWLSDYKQLLGCTDCGYNAHPAALQLDHEGKKSIEIADARSSIHRLLEEIEKGDCSVRCANCHSIKTWERKQK
jgi:hypothetical protein